MSVRARGAVPGSAGAVEAEDVVVRDARTGAVGIRIYRPSRRSDPLPTLIYARGDEPSPDGVDAGDQLARELAAGSGAAVALPDQAPWSQAGLEHCYAAAVWTARHAASRGLDGGRIAVGGDAAGASLAIALTLLAKQRRGPAFVAQLLLCPVIDSALSTSAQELEGLPPALVITAEADVVCDDGEAYAAELRAAGVTVVAVRYQCAEHGFMRRDPLCDAPAADVAIDQATGFLAQALSSG